LYPGGRVKPGIVLATPELPLVEALTRQIDDILERRPATRRTIAMTEDNVRRVFGVALWDLFRELADRFGYEVPEHEPRTR
jgi:hypothetical protein